MKRLFFVLLLLPTVAFGEINPRFDSLRSQVYQALNAPATGTAVLTSAVVGNAVNRGIVAVSRDYLVVEKLDTVSITSTVEGGAVNSDFIAIDFCQRIIGDSVRVGLIPVPKDSIAYFYSSLKSREDVPGAQDNGEGVDRYFVYADKLFIVPKWRLTDSLMCLVGYYAVGDHLTNVTDSTNIKTQYRSAVVDYACWLLEKRRGRPDKAAVHLETYRSGIPGGPHK